MKIKKADVKHVISGLFSNYDINDLTIEEEDITDVVEKIYRNIFRFVI